MWLCSLLCCWRWGPMPWNSNNHKHWITFPVSPSACSLCPGGNRKPWMFVTQGPASSSSTTGSCIASIFDWWHVSLPPFPVMLKNLAPQNLSTGPVRAVECPQGIVQQGHGTMAQAISWVLDWTCLRKIGLVLPPQHSSNIQRTWMAPSSSSHRSGSLGLISSVHHFAQLGCGFWLLQEGLVEIR